MRHGRRFISSRVPQTLLALTVGSGAAWADPSISSPTDTHATRTLERVTVTGTRPSTLPLEIPTTTEGITGAQIERRINATDASDALKYFPSLVVRKRHIGDYDHAVLASRASGTGNSARSLVYVDGILLSNLLGNGADFTPRWGLVSPNEIERVDVLYGPFSAAHSGNSAGAIVDYVTRMPTRFEAHIKVQAHTQKYRLHQTDERFFGHQESASIGSRAGAFSWWIHLNRQDSDGQPLVIARVNRSITPSAVGTPVTGAAADRNHLGASVFNIGSSTQTNSVQDSGKLKLAYDLTSTLRASYTLGFWRNDAQRSSDSFLRDGSGDPVYGGQVNIGGSVYSLPALTPSQAEMQHLAHGLTIKSRTLGVWDWEAAASVYDYRQDRVRTPDANVPRPGAFSGGAGRVVDLGGTGWNTLALKGIWRPEGVAGQHVVEFGVQRDAFKLRRRESNTPSWVGGTVGGLAAAFSGETRLTSLWIQDAWRFAPQWRTVLGGRYEAWRAHDGRRQIGTAVVSYASRDGSTFSPKAAILFDASDDWTLKASIGRAVRNPTVNELFQGGINTTTQLPTLNNPNLRPEKSVTTELTAERALPHGLLRATMFLERGNGALYSQTTPGGTQVLNVDRIYTQGVELALQLNRLFVPGLELSSSLTYADSEIKKNDGYPDTIGKRQPRVPAWRGTLLANYAVNEHWNSSLGIRYSGRQYGQLNNSDTHGHAYQGFSDYIVADVRVQYRVDRQWRASVGIDNLNNDKYWAFHPYPQRTVHAELRFDY